MLKLRKRVVLYIVNADRVLLMDHIEYPGVPTQVPGGTIEPGESPEEAALREGREETGLVDLSIQSLLGTACLGLDHQHDDRGGDVVIIQAWYFYLVTTCPGPDIWQHQERFASGADTPVQLKLYWSPLRYPQGLKSSDALLLNDLVRHRGR